jgi:hypothetical protein
VITLTPIQTTVRTTDAPGLRSLQENYLMDDQKQSFHLRRTDLGTNLIHTNVRGSDLLNDIGSFRLERE